MAHLKAKRLESKVIPYNQDAEQNQTGLGSRRLCQEAKGKNVPYEPEPMVNKLQRRKKEH